MRSYMCTFVTCASNWHYAACLQLWKQNGGEMPALEETSEESLESRNKEGLVPIKNTCKLMNSGKGSITWFLKIGS